MNDKKNCVYRILKHSFVPLISSTGMVYRRLALRVSGRAIALLSLSLVSLLFVVSSATAKPAYTLAAADSQPVKGQPYTAVLPNGITLKMLWCPAGSFYMGSPENELGRYNDELLHQVTLTQGFWLGQYEVTQKQFHTVMSKNPSEYTGNADRPVENVSWNEALAFCQILNDLLGPKLPAGYRFALPTEAQWEYACRAETSSALNSDEDLTSKAGLCANLNNLGWFLQNSGGSTHPVGQKLPNAWGFYDMHGNVREWCRDWYGDYSGDATNPVGVGNGQRRVVRGGSWDFKALDCRSACRTNLAQDYIHSTIGFRLMLSAPQVSSSSSTSAAADSKPVKVQPYTVHLPKGNSLRMLWCPAGSFRMGSPKNELGRDSNETQHKVTLTKGFWLGQYEVTQGQYLAVMGRNPSRFTGDYNRPVERVSWDEAMAFCQRLNNLLGQKLPAGYRFTLPTEAQWEYACRAGMNSALNSGEELTSEYEPCANLNRVGWYCDNSDYSTRPVGKKLPNAWGFYDMHGNVWEWCSDRYGGLSGAVTDPTGPVRGASRVFRGGSCCDIATTCRSAYRDGNAPSDSDSNIGFRPVLAPVR